MPKNNFFSKFTSNKMLLYIRILLKRTKRSLNIQSIGFFWVPGISIICFDQHIKSKCIYYVSYIPSGFSEISLNWGYFRQGDPIEWSMSHIFLSFLTSLLFFVSMLESEYTEFSIHVIWEKKRVFPLPWFLRKNHWQYAFQTSTIFCIFSKQYSRF